MHDLTIDTPPQCLAPNRESAQLQDRDLQRATSEDDDDNSILMQHGRPTPTTGRMKQFASFHVALTPGLVRAQVMAPLQEQMAEWHRNVSGRMRILNDFQEPLNVCSSAPTEPTPEVLIASFAKVLQTLIEQHRETVQSRPEPGVEEGLRGHDPIQQVNESVAVETRRRRTATGSMITGDAEVLAGRRLDNTCDQLEDVIDHVMRDHLDLETRFAIFREFAMMLTRHLHLDFCGQRVLLQLLVCRLPLPNLLDAPQEFHTAEAERILDNVLREVRGFYGNSMELDQTTPMDQEWAVTQMTLASQFAVDVMSFLECGQYDSSHPEDEDTHSMGSNDEYRQGTDRLRNQPGFELHMLSRTTPATTATTSATTAEQNGPDRTLHAHA